MLFHSQSQIESRSRKLFQEPLLEGLPGAALARLELDKIARVVRSIEVYDTEPNQPKKCFYLIIYLLKIWEQHKILILHCRDNQTIVISPKL